MTSLAKTLFDLAEIMKCVEENEGEIPTYLIPSLKQTELILTKKVDDYVGFHDAVEAQIAQTKSLILKFKGTLSALEAVEKRLKDNTKTLMKEHDLIEIKGQYRKIRLCNSGGIEALDLPDDFFEEVKIVNPKYLSAEQGYHREEQGIFGHHDGFFIKDKQKFREAVARGDILGCSIRERGKHVKFV